MYSQTFPNSSTPFSDFPPQTSSHNDESLPSEDLFPPTRKRPMTHYSRLKISSNASLEEIRQAYRVSVKKYHPDKGGCTDTFREIKKSYDILSNPHKRKLYDAYGIEGDQEDHQTVPCNYERASQLFREMFGGVVNIKKTGDNLSSSSSPSSPFLSSHFAENRCKSPTTPKETLVSFQVTLEDLYNGSVRKIQLRRIRCCPCCNYRSKPSMSEAKEWNDFEGMLSADGRCLVCNDKKVVRDFRVFEANIRKGTMNNTKIVYKDEGNQFPNGVSGDVVCVVNEMTHNQFKREEDNLFTSLNISLKDAICGFEITFTHMDGRELRILSQRGEIVRPGDTKCILNEGMPNVSHPHQRGTLTIRFNVELPLQLTDEQILKFELVLPPAQDAENDNPNEDV